MPTTLRRTVSFAPCVAPLVLRATRGALVCRQPDPIVLRVGPQGADGLPGADGADGLQGDTGAAGTSPLRRSAMLGDGSTATMTLDDLPTGEVQIFWDAVRLVEGSDYSRSAQAVTFASAPGVGVTVSAYYGVGAGPSDLTDTQILERARTRCPLEATPVLTAGRLSGFTFADGGGVTNHAKALVYSGSTLASIVESFTFGGWCFVSTTLLTAVPGSSVPSLRKTLTKTPAA